MKTLKAILVFIVPLLFPNCGDPNHPVQTAHDQPDTTLQTGAANNTPDAKTDSAGSKGPDQMVPENTGSGTTTPH